MKKEDTKGQDMNNSAMTVVPKGEVAAPVNTSQLMQWSPQDVVAHVRLVQEVMKSVMKDGTHFGTIPGCGDKPSLLLPGAETICMTFRLAPRYQVATLDMPGGHREYRVTCELHHIVTGNFVGSAVGTACTMETKWRFRAGPVTFTGKPVPKAYWDTRESDPSGAMQLIGGKGHSVKKNPDNGMWEIVEKGETVEHDNPADHYNTAMKIAAKRAFTSAAKGSTAASDIFTVDIEDLPQDLREVEVIQTRTVSSTEKVTTEKSAATKSAKVPPMAKPEQVVLKQDVSGNPQVEITFLALKQENLVAKTSKKPYTKYTATASDKQVYVTIMRDTAKDINNACKQGLPVLVTYTVNKFNPGVRDVLVVSPIDAGSGTVTVSEYDADGRDDEGADKASLVDSNTDESDAFAARSPF